MAFDFDINLYHLPFEVPVDANLWADLNDGVSENSLSKQGFRIPSQRAMKEWDEMLKVKFGISEHVFYDPEIVGLPSEVTAEELERARLNWCSRLVSDGKPVPPPESITPEQYLISRQFQIFLKQDRILAELMKRGISEISEEERRIAVWRPGFGFLWDYHQGEGLLQSRPKNESILRYEAIREYFFHHPLSPGIVLSVAQEPNSDRAIWGLRRDLFTDFPSKFNEEAVGGINYLTENLEKVLRGGD